MVCVTYRSIFVLNLKQEGGDDSKSRKGRGISYYLELPGIDYLDLGALTSHRDMSLVGQRGHDVGSSTLTKKEELVPRQTSAINIIPRAHGTIF